MDKDAQDIFDKALSAALRASSSGSNSNHRAQGSRATHSSEIELHRRRNPSSSRGDQSRILTSEDDDIDDSELEAMMFGNSSTTKPLPSSNTPSLSPTNFHSGTCKQHSDHARTRDICGRSNRDGGGGDVGFEDESSDSDVWERFFGTRNPPAATDPHTSTSTITGSANMPRSCGTTAAKRGRAAETGAPREPEHSNCESRPAKSVHRADDKAKRRQKEFRSRGRRRRNGASASFPSASTNNAGTLPSDCMYSSTASGSESSSPPRGSAIKRRRSGKKMGVAVESNTNGLSRNIPPPGRRRPNSRNSRAERMFDVSRAAKSRANEGRNHPKHHPSSRRREGVEVSFEDNAAAEAKVNRMRSSGEAQVSFDETSSDEHAGAMEGVNSDWESEGRETEGDDDLEEEDRFKPTLPDAPFEDPEMRPLALENEGGGERAKVPAAVNRYLHGFQREGVEFLWRRIRHSEGPKGAILADDMGVGKTVQIVALLTALLKKTGTKQDLKELKERLKRKVPVSAAKGGKPVLIVCPSGLVDSWQEHLGKWGYFESQDVRSSKGIGNKSMQSVEARLDAGSLEVVCIGYDLFTSNRDSLAKFEWLLVVFDEMHVLKNPKSQRSQAVETLVGAEVFIGLTGTLIQNELAEFWWLMNMIQNGVLKTDAEFMEYFGKPILYGKRKGASKREVELRSSRLQQLGVIRDKMVLRRTKEQVLGDLLRGKTGTVVFCKLAPVQNEIYRTILGLPECRLLAVAADPCACGRNENSGKCCGVWPSDASSEDSVSKRAVLWRKYHPNLETCGPRPACPYCCFLPIMQKLQKVANHPCLLQVDSREPNAVLRQENMDFAEVAFNEDARAIMAPRDQDEEVGGWGGGGEGGWGDGRGANGVDKRLLRSENFLQLSRDDLCGKMKTLKVLLRRFRRPAKKVLLFSYSTATLDLLQVLMIKEGYTFLRLDGSTKMEDRGALIKRYNQGDAIDSFVFLISTRAGGTGLNLHSANKVILYDVNWNPSQDTQAEDRAYRIGQTGKVEVYRLVSTGTIEELTYMRQIYKLQTSAAAMGNKAEGGLRQFEGVQGDPSQRGELWGISNLMRLSGDSMLLSLREQLTARPPIVPAEDGLLMEREQDIVDMVSRAARDATQTALGVADARVEGDIGRGYEGGSLEQQEEEEEEFDGVRSVSGRRGTGLKNAGGGGSSGGDDDDLGGVAMPHDEMVAVDREQELPEASQQSFAVTQDEDYETPSVADNGLAREEDSDASIESVPSTSTVASSVCATTTDRRVPVVSQASRQVIDGSSASNCPVMEHTSAATSDSEARQRFKDGGISGSGAAGTAATTAGQGSRLTLRRISVVSKALPDTERDRRGHERCDDDEASWPTDWLAAATQAPVGSTTTTEEGVRGSGSEEMDYSHAAHGGGQGKGFGSNLDLGRCCGEQQRQELSRGRGRDCDPPAQEDGAYVAETQPPPWSP